MPLKRRFLTKIPQIFEIYLFIYYFTWWLETLLAKNERKIKFFKMIDESFLVRKLVSEFNSIQNTCYTIAFLCYAKVFFTKKMS